MDTLLGILQLCNALSLIVYLKILLLLIRILAEGGRRREGVAEVGELLVVARWSVSIRAYFFVRHKCHREAGGDPFSCVARFTFASLQRSCHLESNQGTK